MTMTMTMTMNLTPTTTANPTMPTPSCDSMIQELSMTVTNLSPTHGPRPPSRATIAVLVGALSAALAGCGSAAEDGVCSAPGADDVAVETLQWKRMRAVESDLMQAMQLDRNELCQELDLVDCAEVHRVALGASNPIGAALYEPVAKPLATTPLALERLVIAACSRRADRDAAGAPAVFDQFALSGDAPAGDAPEVAELAQDLYRLLLQRDPTDSEITTLGQLTSDDQGQPVSGRDFAALSCFAIATTTEFLFF
ncbi:MAG: hypothetical protein AAGC55_16465 [Myxococcota bacterium]